MTPPDSPADQWFRYQKALDRGWLGAALVALERLDRALQDAGLAGFATEDNGIVTREWIAHAILDLRHRFQTGPGCCG